MSQTLTDKVSSLTVEDASSPEVAVALTPSQKKKAKEKAKKAAAKAAKELEEKEVAEKGEEEVTVVVDPVAIAKARAAAMKKKKGPTDSVAEKAAKEGNRKDMNKAQKFYEFC